MTRRLRNVAMRLRVVVGGTILLATARLTVGELRVAPTELAVLQAAGSGPSRPIAVSPAIMGTFMLRKTNPVYTTEAIAAGVSGAVVVRVTIGKDGSVTPLSVLSGPTVLQPIALDTVKQWAFRPYLLNGQPAEVTTVLTVNFLLTPADRARSRQMAADKQAAEELADRNAVKLPIPKGLLMCDTTHCTDDTYSALWLFDGSTGKAERQGQIIGKLEVVRFDDVRIEIHYVDSYFKNKYVYTGVMHGDRIVGNAERPSRSMGQLNDNGPWYAVVPKTSCPATTPPMDVGGAIKAGYYAYKVRDLTASFDCDMIAAKQGNSIAEMEVGVKLHDGSGTPVNKKEAFRWMQMSAAQGDYMGEVELANMYELGEGTPVDHAKAKIWIDKANAQVDATNAKAEKEVEGLGDLLKSIMMGPAAAILRQGFIDDCKRSATKNGILDPLLAANCEAP